MNNHFSFLLRVQLRTAGCSVHCHSGTWAGGRPVFIHPCILDKTREKVHCGHSLALKTQPGNDTGYFLSHFICQRNSGSQLMSKDISQVTVTMFTEGDEPPCSGSLVISGNRIAIVLFTTCRHLETRNDSKESSKICFFPDVKLANIGDLHPCHFK